MPNHGESSSVYGGFSSDRQGLLHHSIVPLRYDHKEHPKASVPLRSGSVQTDMRMGSGVARVALASGEGDSSSTAGDFTVASSAGSSSAFPDFADSSQVPQFFGSYAFSHRRRWSQDTVYGFGSTFHSFGDGSGSGCHSLGGGVSVFIWILFRRYQFRSDPNSASIPSILAGLSMVGFLSGNRGVFSPGASQPNGRYCTTEDNAAAADIAISDTADANSASAIVE